MSSTKRRGETQGFVVYDDLAYYEVPPPALPEASQPAHEAISAPHASQQEQK